MLTHLKNNNQQCSGNYGTLNSRPSLTEYVNRLTYDGNSALMWAAWSGTLETVKLLVRSTADTTVANRNGCTVAHWAASGGNLKVCMYLSNTANVDFSVPNYGGNTPLSHAVAFGRTDVVQWLLKLLSEADNDEMMAYSLAQDFVQWTKGDDAQRKQVLQLFENDWLSTDMLTSVTEKEIDEDDFY
jgi:ankyrin repeat protein